MVICVSDTGIGNACRTSWLKRPIHSLLQSLSAKEPGLGLSMIYGFAKQGRGHLRIYSEIGHGTVLDQFEGRRVLQGAGSGKPWKSPRGQGETILVVEDAATVRLVLSDALEELGYNVLLASDARPAIPILRSNSRIDLMVSDVVLPHIDGRKLAEIARAARPDLKILFVTGYAEHAAFEVTFSSRHGHADETFCPGRPWRQSSRHDRAIEERRLDNSGRRSLRRSSIIRRAYGRRPAIH